MRVKILRVDHYGYNGRDHHPTDADIGKCLRVLSAVAWTEEGIGTLAEHPAPESVSDEDTYMVFECISLGGKRLTLLEHEVEVRQ